MEDVLKHLTINWTSIFCILSLFLATEGSQIQKTTGSPVNLPCDKESSDNFTQLTWKMNGINLFSYTSSGALHHYDKAVALDLNISTSTFQLVISKAQKHHTGNYSCELTTLTLGFDQEWELIVTEEEEDKLNVLVISVGTVVVCVCLLIFILAWFGLRTICKNQEMDINSRGKMQKEEIYENVLKIEQGNDKHYRYKPY